MLVWPPGAWKLDGPGQNERPWNAIPLALVLMWEAVRMTVSSVKIMN